MSKCEQRFCKPKWEGGVGGWMEGTEHRGETCLGPSPAATPIDGVEWERRLFTLHKVIILTSNCLSSSGSEPDPLQLHIHLPVIFSVACSNICLAKPAALYKCLSGTAECHCCAFFVSSLARLMFLRRQLQRRDLQISEIYVPNTSASRPNMAYHRHAHRSSVVCA